MKPGFGVCDCPSCRRYRLRRATRPHLLTRWDWAIMALCLIAFAVCIALEVGG